MTFKEAFERRFGKGSGGEMIGRGEAGPEITNNQLPVFWEAPPERAEQTIALIAGHNSDEDTATFGYKLRTGGVTVDAFPTSAQIASALVTAATHQ